MPPIALSVNVTESGRSVSSSGKRLTRENYSSSSLSAPIRNTITKSITPTSAAHLGLSPISPNSPISPASCPADSSSYTSSQTGDRATRFCGEGGCRAKRPDGDVDRPGDQQLEQNRRMSRKAPLPDFKALLRAEKGKERDKEKVDDDLSEVSSNLTHSRRNSRGSSMSLASLGIARRTRKASGVGDEDFFKQVSEYLHPKKKREFSKKHFLTRESTLGEALEQMAAMRAFCLWVVENTTTRRIVGVLSLRDVLHAVFSASF